jgi:hypothetical protein
MLSSKKYTLWGLKSNWKPLEPKNGICWSCIFYKSCDLSIDQKFYVELKKVYFMGSEMQPGVTRAQKREIQISHVKKILYLV